MGPGTASRPDSEEDQDSDGLEHQWNQPPIEDFRRNNANRQTPNPADLALKEADGSGLYDEESPSAGPAHNEQEALQDKTGGGFYRRAGAAVGKVKASGKGSGDSGQQDGGGSGFLSGFKNKISNRAANLSSGKKKALFGFGLGGSGLAILLFVAIILFATLKIPNLAEHIAGFQMARTGRAFRQSMDEVSGEKIAVDTASEADKGKLKSFYEGVRSDTWGKLDKWRPERTFKNMQATGDIDFVYSEPTWSGYQRIEAVRIKGNEIPIDKVNLWQRVKNKVNPLTPKDDITFGAEISANLDNAMQTNHTFIRSAVANKIYEKVGVKLHWWDKFGKDFTNTKENAADALELKNRVERVNEKPSTGSVIPAIDDAVTDAQAQQDACIADPQCAEALTGPSQNAPTDPAEIAKQKADQTYASSRTISDGADKAIESQINDPKIHAVETFSTVAQVALAMCTIYDGSVEHSQGTVDAQSGTAIKQFFSIESAADQQKAGKTTAEAVGATNRALGDISPSIPEQRARNRNIPVPTDKVSSPQAGAGGTFGLFAALFPGGQKFDTVVSPVCHTVADWRVGAAIGVIEVALAVVTDGDSKAADALAEGSWKVASKEIIASVRRTIINKKAVVNLLGQAAGLAGLTILAKTIVLSRLDALQGGTLRQDDLANAADVGGNLAGNEMCRQMMYGRPLTQPEAASSDQANVAYLNDQKGQESVYQRYLALDNPDSLLVNMGVGMSEKLTNVQTFGQTLAGTASRFNTSIFSSGLAGALNPFKQQMAFAQANNNNSDTNYHNIQWCWSEDELKTIQNDPTYFPLANDVILKQSGKEGDIEKKYNECFTKTMGELLSGGDIQRDSDGNVYENGGLCSPHNLGKDNNEFGPAMVMRWRLSKRNNNVLDHLNDIADPTGDSGSGSASLVDPNLPQGTPDELIQQIKATGNIQGGANLLNPQMKRTILAVILKLAQKYKFSIWQTTGGGGPHAAGLAVDLGNIDNLGVPTGEDYSGFNDRSLEFIKDAATLLPGQSWIGLPNDQYKGPANDIMRPKGGSADLDTPATTQAKGAHFHLNCAADAP